MSWRRQSENWLPLHAYLGLYWLCHGWYWLGGLMVFAFVFDLLDYQRELSLGRREVET